jgi:hypothetical protein
MTVTGLSTLNLSTLSGFQQAIVFMNMFIGSPIFVSLIMISVRKYFFQKEFDHIIEARRKAAREAEAGGLRSPLRKLRSMSQNFTGQGRPNIQQTSWIERFKRKTGPDKKKRSDSPMKDGEVAPSEDSSHMETRDTWKKDISQGGIFTANPTYATDKTPNGDIPVEKPATQRPNMERQPTNWGWHWGKQETQHKPRINADMIKRVEGGGLGLINPMGWYQSSSAPGSTAAFASFAPTPTTGSGPGILDNPLTNAAPAEHENDMPPLTESPRSMNARLPDVERTRTRSPEPDLPRRESEPPIHVHPQLPPEDKFPRTKTIAFDGIDDPPRTAYASGRDTAGMYTHTPGHGYMPRTGTIRSAGNPGIIGNGAGTGGYGLDRTMTGRRSVAGSRSIPLAPTMNTGYMPRTFTVNQAAKHQNFGGFPTPLALGKALFVKVFPDTGEKLKRNLTMHRTITQAGTMTQTADGVSEVRPVDYISFDASTSCRWQNLDVTNKLITGLRIVVGRNSHFHDLTKEEHDELGGVEYRSLRILFWLVLAVSCLISQEILTMTSLTRFLPFQYYILCPLIGFIIVGPYIRAGWDYTLRSDVQYRYVPPLWFSAFQMWSAFSNTGMSLNDLSMIPYQKAYPMIFVMVFLIFAGNTAFPILWVQCASQVVDYR